MRRGLDDLASIVQDKQAADPFARHVFVFRGRRGDLVKLLSRDADGALRFCPAPVARLPLLATGQQSLGASLVRPTLHAF